MNFAHHVARPDIALVPHVFSDSQRSRLLAEVANWFAEHAEMDLDRFLTLLDAARAS